jgi:anti-sigma factor RsiW
MNHMLNCHQCMDFLADYLDGSLPPAQRAVFQKHLSLCPQCVRYIESYKECIQLGKACCHCDQDEIPPEVPDDLVKAILAAREKGQG